MATSPTLPDYPGASTTPLSFTEMYLRAGREMRERSNITSRPTLNRTATRNVRRAVAGEGALIPDVFGLAWVPAKIPTIVEYNNKLVMLCIWCAGEVQSVEEVRIGGSTFTGTTTHYTGTSGQAADATLSAAIAGYTDALAGICYSVLELSSSDDVAQNIEAKIKGKKVYDSRTTTTIYSTNPSLILAHIIREELGRTVDDASLTTCANDNETTLSDGSARRDMGILVDRTTTIADWIDTLREYAGVYVVWDDPVVLIPDRPRSTDHTITAGMIEGIKLSKRSGQNVPNRYGVRYTDTSEDEWRTHIAYTPVPSGDLRLAIVDMQGIQSYAQAYRQGIERLNARKLADLDAVIDVFDEGLEYTAGDVIDVTHRYGLTNKLFRILSANLTRLGRWRLECSEYDPAVYSDAIPSGPTFTDTSLPNPLDVPELATPTLVEENYQQENGNWSTRLRITWSAVTYPFEFRYKINVTDGSSKVWSGETTDTEFVTGALKAGLTYLVSVQVIGFNNLTGTAGTESLEAGGKTAVPSNVTGLNIFEIGGQVRGSWNKAVDVFEDVLRYEIRSGAEGVTWANATYFDQIDATRFETKDFAPGTYDILIKAIDSVGGESTAEARATIEVTLDPVANPLGSGYFATNETDSSNVIEHHTGKWVTDVSSDDWDSLFPSTFDTYTSTLLSYHASATSAWYSDSLDVGAVKSATWQGIVDAEALSGSITAVLQTSDDDSTWSTHSGLSVQATARYARIKVSATTTSTLAVDPDTAFIRADAIPREETGQETTNGSGKATVTLSNTYSELVSINLQPSGTAARSAVYDNVNLTAGTFDIYLFDSSGTAVTSEAVSWLFKGT